MNKETKLGPEVDGAALAVLMEHRRGEVLSDISQALREVAGAVLLVGKSGTVTIKLKVAVAQGTRNTLVISDEITAKIPKADKQGSIFFADHNNNLVREDPDPASLPLQIVDLNKSKPAVPVVDLSK